MSPSPDVREIHTGSAYLSKGAVRYHEGWDNKYRTCTIGSGWGEDVRREEGKVWV